MTSANVSEYTIFNSQGDIVGHHRQHWMCKTKWEELLKYIPLEQHSIIEHGYDEEEEYWEEESVNLREFLSNKIKEI